MKLEAFERLVRTAGRGKKSDKRVRLPVIPEPQVPWDLRLPAKGVRVRAVPMRKMTDPVETFLYPERDFPRPKTRADCEGVPRPCPYVGCRHHLYMDVTEAGSIRVMMDGEVWEMAESCALDLADRYPDGLTLEEVGDILGLTRERVRQIEDTAFCHLDEQAQDAAE